MKQLSIILAFLCWVGCAHAQTGDVSNPQTNASALTTGTLPAGRMPALTGDCTTSAGAVATTCTKTSGTAFTAGATAAAGQLPGIASNTAASAGNVGEYITSSVASPGSAISNNVAANITSVSITAGDWDCRGNAYVAPGGTITQVEAYITQTTAADPTRPNGGGQAQWSGSTTSAIGVGIPTMQQIVSGTTTVFLGIDSQFTVSATAFGFIGCRRVR
jgi:hypothetical protein